MTRLFTASVLLLSLTVAFFLPRAHVSAAASPTTRVFIQLSGPPVAADLNLKDRSAATRFRNRLDFSLPATKSYTAVLDRYREQEISFLRSHGISLDIHYQFNTLFNGFSADVPRTQLSKLRTLTNVSAVLPDHHFVPLDDRSFELVNVPKAWSFIGGQAGAGKGVFIADIDTGIDVNSPCFKPNGVSPPPFGIRADSVGNKAYTNNKVIVARAFGSNQNAQFSARDDDGHGTFTSAIEACDANTPTPLGTKVSGVAPDAYVGNYNVFPSGSEDPNNQGNEDPIIAALQAALQDGADVANLSLGLPTGPGDSSLDPEIPFVTLASRAGMVMVVSAGNSGPTSQSVTPPATSPDAIAVGSVTNSRAITAAVNVTGPALPAALSHFRASLGSHVFTATAGGVPLVYVGLGRKPGDDTAGLPTSDLNADDLAGKDLHGKIALIQRGNITFEKKINNVAAAGAVAAIVFDNHFEIQLISMSMGTATLPSMFLSQADGKALLDYITQHPDATASLDPTKVAIDETPNVLSDFSARGYGPNYSIKPDLIAPGQDIYSATETETPNNQMYDPSGFTSQQGTSFSAPHVTGAVALLEQKHSGQKWTTDDYKAVLMETAARDVVTNPGEVTPGVMEVGAGMMDVQSAVAADAYLLPYSASLGQVNTGAGAVHRTISLSLANAGGSAGAWTSQVQVLHSNPGISITPPASIDLPAGGKAAINVAVDIAANTAPGDYDGYLVFQKGAETLHVPYYVHVASQAVTAASVLLVDATASRFAAEPPAPPVQHKDVSSYYEKALTAIGKTYTYWDEAVQGSPSLDDMKKASAVIYFTGNNLNDYASQNNNSEALLGPLSTIDVSNIHQYMNGGGRVFVSGMGAALSDFAWVQIILGAGVAGLSMYDNGQNDPKLLGGIAPPQPSASVDTRPNAPENPYLFSGLKQIDFSGKGDGANDNVGVASTVVEQAFSSASSPMKIVGVTALSPFTAPAQDNFYPASYGRAVLRTTDSKTASGDVDVGIQSSDEPSLKNKEKTIYPGRSVFFSFGFEGINDNTGFATRAEVLKRIFDWFGDTPSVIVKNAQYTAGRKSQLKATATASSGAHAVSYDWEIGKTILPATKKPTTYTFPHAGSYKVRVQITDSLGHSAVSAWKTIRVH